MVAKREQARELERSPSSWLEGPAPFWSPFWVSTAHHRRTCRRCRQPMGGELDAIAASLALLLHAVQCIQASQRAIGEEVEARGAVVL